MTPRISALLAGLLVLTACSAGSTPAPSPTSSPAASPTAVQPASGPAITISGMTFTSPSAVAPGATITVTNSDSVEHSVTADTGNAFDVEVDGKGTATFTAPTQPGTYPYHCTYHPSMHGQLIVG
ncbi:cupredoxin domain-containing protein [Mycolicibacterium vinylchloridicum]|uniref:cupredoxin domain-containing protein n=1 Tax=Mycolicibacterium vinylchloridicum TaxID=2736928 RepID=UPI0015CD95A7|nr:cupredoxin domain-containing protein [Mycolicibacterium vinylchloridicum]